MCISFVVSCHFAALQEPPTEVLNRTEYNGHTKCSFRHNLTNRNPPNCTCTSIPLCLYVCCKCEWRLFTLCKSHFCANSIYLRSKPARRDHSEAAPRLRHHFSANLHEQKRRNELNYYNLELNFPISIWGCQRQSWEWVGERTVGVRACGRGVVQIAKGYVTFVYANYLLSVLPSVHTYVRPHTEKCKAAEERWN